MCLDECTNAVEIALSIRDTVVALDAIEKDAIRLGRPLTEWPRDLLRDHILSAAQALADVERAHPTIYDSGEVDYVEIIDALARDCATQAVTAPATVVSTYLREVAERRERSAALLDVNGK